MDQTPLPEGSASLRETRKKQFAKVRNIVLLTAGGAILLFFLIILGLYLFLPKPDDTPPPEKEIHFYPVQEVDIFENENYLWRDRAVHYCENPDGTGLTTTITDEDRDTFDAKVRFLESYINIVINGDNETYRTLFTASYLRANELPVFTQQMIYDIVIRYYSTEALSGGGQRVTYRLDYKILFNNGTYRRDVGSEAVRPQFIVLNVAPDGSILIDGIYYYRETTK